jgi:hypothetical protein
VSLGWFEVKAAAAGKKKKQRNSPRDILQSDQEHDNTYLDWSVGSTHTHTHTHTPTHQQQQKQKQIVSVKKKKHQ